MARTVSDAKGRFAFLGLESGRRRLYAVGASYKQGFYVSGTTSIPDDHAVVDAALAVWETTADPTSIQVRRDEIVATPKEGGVDVIESLKVVNTSDRAYVGRGSRIVSNGAPAPTLGVSLPVGAVPASLQLISSDLNFPSPVGTDFGFALTVAIPPGEHTLMFSYRVPTFTGNTDLSRIALYPTSSFSVRAAPPLIIRGRDLVGEGSVTLAGKSYRKWSVHEVRPGEPLEIMATAQAGFSYTLTGGLIIGLVLVVAVALGTLRRRSHRAKPRGKRPSDIAEVETITRQDLVLAIARLDVDHEGGKCSDAEWSHDRGKLKARLKELTPREPVS